MYPRTVVSRALREMRDVARGASRTHLHLRDRIVAVVLISLVVEIVAAVLAFFLERRAPATEIKTFGDAMFWSATQLLTVSSSIKNPVSVGGKVLDVALEAYAIIVVATLAGSFSSFFHRRGRERDAAEDAGRAPAPG